MKNKNTLFVLVLVFVLLILGAYVLYDRFGQGLNPPQLVVQQTETRDVSQPTQGETQPPELVKAPDFTVYTQDGEAVQLSDYIGKPIVLNFWASWCGPCKMEMPDFQKQYEQLEGAVHFLMINMTDGSRETVDSASAFIQKQGYTFPVFFDTQSYAAMTYGVYSLPTTYFINADGYAVAQATGAINEETLQRGIALLTP